MRKFLIVVSICAIAIVMVVFSLQAKGCDRPGRDIQIEDVK